ncbi:MAG: CBS domain-containing protein [Gammaproteobacteria bacterium]
MTASKTLIPAGGSGGPMAAEEIGGDAPSFSQVDVDLLVEAFAQAQLDINTDGWLDQDEYTAVEQASNGEDMVTVRDIMTSNPACCTPDTGLHDVAKLMVEYDCGEIPVVESMDPENMDILRPVGMITDRDISCRAVAQGKNALDMTVAECMTTPCVTLPENSGLEHCCAVLEQYQIRRAPVVDRDGRLCGIVSQADIAHSAPKEQLAEVLRAVSQRSSADSRVQPQALLYDKTVHHGGRLTSRI